VKKNFDAFDPTLSDFSEAVEVTRYLAKHTPQLNIFEHTDYLNVNTHLPTLDGTRRRMKVTRPSHEYDMGAVQDDDKIRLKDRIWDRIAAGSITDPEGTDRRAILEGSISVSPLTVPHFDENHRALDGIVEPFNGT